MHPTSDSISTSGLTRRQVLQRGAIAGGAVLAAQSLGTVAAYAQTSSPPPPPPPPPPPGVGYPSNFQLAVRVDGVVYGVKYDEDDGGWGKIGSGGACLQVAYEFNTPKSVFALFANSVTKVNGVYVLTVPAGVEVVSAVTHDGTYKPTNCSVVISANGDGTYSFAKKP